MSKITSMESIIAAHDEAACSDEEVDVEEEPLFSEASSSSKMVMTCTNVRGLTVICLNLNRLQMKKNQRYQQRKLWSI